MAKSGADTNAIASVVGAAALPWTLKLLNGFLMDRYTWLAMGRRRVWLLGAQSLLSLGFVVGAITAPAANDVLLLSLLAFFINTATAFQDVAIDSIVVDVMPEAEQSKAGGVMFGAQAIGGAFTVALGGWLVSRFGVSVLFLFCVGVSLLGLAFGVMVRERPNEKRLPWSPGEVHPRNLSLRIDAWVPLLKETLRAMLVPSSLLIVPFLLMRAVPLGASGVFTPYMATHRTGWTTVEVTNLTSSAGLGVALFVLFLGGWIVAKTGALRALRVLLMTNALFFGALAAFDSGWADSRFLIAYVWLFNGIELLLAVTILPIAMQACSPRVAATQFSIYAALSNFGRPFGAWLAAGKTETNGPALFSAIAGLFLVGAVGSWFITLSKPPAEVEVATLPLASGAPGEN